MRKIWKITVALAGLLAATAGWAAGAPPRTETMAEKTLKEIVARQRDILAKADKEGDQLDVARLRGELQSVINSYDVLIQKNPDFAPAYVTYGMLLGQVGMTREAVGILLKANKLEPNLPLVKNEIGRHLAEDGKLVEALPWIMAAIDLEPKEPLYHYHLGKLLTEGRDDFIKTGQFTRPALDQAMLDAFRRAAELAPGDLSLSYRYAKAYFATEPPRTQEVLPVLDELESRATTPSMKQLVRLRRAEAFLKLGRRDEARTQLDGVTELQLAQEKQTLLDQLAKAGEK